MARGVRRPVAVSTIQTSTRRAGLSTTRAAAMEVVAPLGRSDPGSISNPIASISARTRALKGVGAGATKRTLGPSACAARGSSAASATTEAAARQEERPRIVTARPGCSRGRRARRRGSAPGSGAPSRAPRGDRRGAARLPWCGRAPRPPEDPRGARRGRPRTSGGPRRNARAVEGELAEVEGGGGRGVAAAEAQTHGGVGLDRASAAAREPGDRPELEQIGGGEAGAEGAPVLGLGGGERALVSPARERSRHEARGDAVDGGELEGLEGRCAGRRREGERAEGGCPEARAVGATSTLVSAGAGPAASRSRTTASPRHRRPARGRGRGTRRGRGRGPRARSRGEPRCPGPSRRRSSCR